MNRERIRKTLLFLISPQWHGLYKARIAEVSLTRKQEISAIVERQRSLYLLTAFGFWILFSFVTGIFSLIKNNLFGVWAAPTAVLLVLMLFVVIATYRGLLNFWAIKNLSVPDHARITASDTPLSVLDLPEPSPGSFAIGINDRGPLMYSLGKPTFAGNLAIAGRLQFREHLHDALLYGVMSDPNFVALIFDTDGGLDFSYLRYDYRELLGLPNLEKLFTDERLTELVKISALPRVIVRSEDGNGEIQDSLNWLSGEFSRRSRIKALEPESNFAPLLIVLDDVLASAFLNKGKGESKGIYQVDVLHSIAMRGRMLAMHLLIVLPTGKDWSSMDDDFKEFFACLEVHHTKFIGKEGNIAAIKNIVPANDMVFQIYHKGTPYTLKAPTVKPKELAARIYEKSADMPKPTRALEQACRNNRTYRDLDKPAINILLKEAA